MGSPSEWGTCAYCGEAFPPTAKSCPTCGDRENIQHSAVASLPKRRFARFRLVQVVRVLAIVGVIGGLAWATLAGGFSAPTVADPLTTSGWHDVGPGNFSFVWGPITGEDYIVGNYTVVNPPGAPLTFEVFNSSGFTAFSAHAAAQPLYTQSGSSGRIIFAAPYTDTFYLVFQNGFAATTGIDLHVFVVTNYESNVVVD